MASRLISVTGSLNMDLITVLCEVPAGGESVPAVEPLMECPGGKGANQAMAAHRLSRYNPSGPVMAKYKDKKGWSEVEVLLVGCVGDDEYGKKILAELERAGLSTECVKPVQRERTGVAIIRVQAGSGESRVMLHPGANYHLKSGDFRTLRSLTGCFDGKGLPRKPDLLVLQMELHRDTIEQIIHTARENEVQVLLNAAPAVCLLQSAWRGVTHLIVNESEGLILLGKDPDDTEYLKDNWGKFTDTSLDRGVKNVVVTLGPLGAYFSSKRGEGRICQAQCVEVVDTTTAGDTFVGAYAVEVVYAQNPGSRWDLEKAVRRACRAAECTVQKKGTQESIPWRDDVTY